MSDQIFSLRDQRTGRLPLAHTHAQLDVMRCQIAYQPTEGPDLVKGTEHTSHDVLHLFIRVELDLSRWAPDIANGEGKLEVTSPSFTQAPLIHTLFEDVQFCF